ncbi:Fructosamine kinase-domain-containing protein [Xylariaceae sp. FL1019]|nr:Fructosamine kinase-domain-containing protein [Xylariaceae sp. FL1019]
MVQIDAEFNAPTVPDEEAYEGTELDENVKNVLPKGSVVKWVATRGASFWAINSKVDTELPDGKLQSYFLKVYTAERAKEMAFGELEGSKALFAALPANVPKPVAAGALAKDPSRHFYLAEFRDMADEMPGATDFVSLVAKLHQTTESPNGKFGFHTKTYGGDNPLDTSWCDSWEQFFTRMMKQVMDRERAIHGPNEELDRLSPMIIDQVIPRLIRPMESEGRKIKPVLIHGDLWHGNVAVDNVTHEPVLYDPCAFYAHCEFEFAPWRAARYRTTRDHVRAYYEIDAAQETEPSEDLDDRLALYALRLDLMVSVSWPNNKRTRQLAVEEMKRLTEKYCSGTPDEGIEGV